jgi:metal-dependent amidase/aminoacylase/carboxypeptidase family protein
MASSDPVTIVVHGRQTHGALPWRGIDPITVAAQIVTGLQTIVSRQTDLTAGPAVVTIGSIQGGVRGNIIPTASSCWARSGRSTPQCAATFASASSAPPS